MKDYITASPLTWPDGWRRTKEPKHSRFGTWNKKVTIHKATNFVLEELRLMGVDSQDVIISTNLRLRLDGLPYSNQREPEDQGVSVWWDTGEDMRVLALDKYNRIADNMWAIGKTIEAMRGIERWGSGEILERTFTGFTALPDPNHVPESWRTILDFHGDDPRDLKNHYYKLRGKYHPDRGGNVERYVQLAEAYEQGVEALT